MFITKKAFQEKINEAVSRREKEMWTNERICDLEKRMVALENQVSALSGEPIEPTLPPVGF